ncbi:hypothetical protein ILUMI_05576, partial [Ignelater luminosus]
MLKSTSAVQITTFVNPHLFWFFEKNEEEKRVAFEKCISCNARHLSLERHAQIGQTVLIYDKSIWKRAIVKSIENNSYTTWLIDYGVTYISNKLYQLPKEFQHQPAFAKQAALNDVVNVKHVLGGVKIELTSTKEFCCGTVKKAKEKIDRAHSIFFGCLIERNNIHLGEVNIIDSNNRLYDLAKVLVEECNLTYNKELFDEALEVNSKIDDWDIFSSIKSITPCTSMMYRKNLDVFQGIEDIVEVKSCGRGVLRNSHPKKKTEIRSKKYLENWLEESKKTKQSEELYSESDNESRISESSPRKTQNETSSDDSLNSLNADLPNNSCSSLTSEVNGNASKEELNKKELTSLSLNRSDYSTDDTVSGCSVSGRLLANIRKSLESNRNTKTTSSTPSPNAKTCEASKWEPLASTSSTKRLLNLMPAGMTIPLPCKKVSKSQNSRATSNQFSPHTATNQSTPDATLSQSSKRVSDRQSSKELETVSSNKNEIANERLKFLKKNICLPGCKCPDCFICTMEDINNNDDNEFIDTPPKKEKAFSKPPLLLKLPENGVPEMASRVSITSSMSTTERAKAPKLLVHGYSLPSPVAYVNQAPFHKDIHRALRSFEAAYTIQSYAWPCLMRNFPVCIVNSAKSGKTIAYLPAICSYLLDRQDRYDELSGKTISPFAIIVCPRSKTAEEVYDTMKKLIEYSSNKPDCILAIPPLDKQCLNNFQKQCDALVTTPLTLLSLLHSRIITVKR